MRGAVAASVAGIVLLPAALGLAGCAAASAPRVAPVAATADDLPYNLTDVLFTREMILHYQQAVILAELVPGRGGSAYVREVAGRITRDERPKIDALAGTLRAWSFQVPDLKEPPKHNMDGMLSPAQLLMLRKRSGAEFDRLWLTTLARHYTYGVRLADKARAEGKDRATVARAGAAGTAQRALVTEIVRHLS
ncbi:hypothetical protein Sru01_43230 [Sphaerisporangium rufum]|uniref:DUF305 domain-containing protein n=1 Tax=Sphaerisporangium rufum TaxID=1381558 RepID=A0A919R439_9ACTN|nr:DUF305 domain-containing protein [Sphaerisporangium rufum]GII79341.1 hypothetical protein Sru01_43230 [Sphaerisporangium rufum]